MTGGESITPSSMSVYDMHHVGYGIFQIGGTKAFHIRAYQCCPRLVGNGNYECQTDHAEQSHFPMEVAQHHIPNGSIHRHPDPLTAVGTHKVIEKVLCIPLMKRNMFVSISIAPCKASISAVILYTLILYTLIL